jgi:putative ABC transport system permease protein
LKEGNPDAALSGINKVVISNEVANKLFGNEPALGKILLFGEERKAIEVTGVTEHQPVNTHFHFDYLLSMENNPSVKNRDWSWVWTQVVTYARLKPGADPKVLETKMADMAEKIIKPAFEARGMNYDNTKGTWNFILRPMHDIHLKSGDNRLGPVSNIQYVYTFGVTAIFILVIAAINFINLSTARGAKRAKEVGVKKTLGALRGSLISQFQSESIFLAIFSTLMSLGLVEGLRWMVALVSGIEIPFTLWQEKEMLLALPLFAVVIGIVAGIYPSIYLTAFRPVQVLKGKIATGFNNSSLRNSLVIIQFTISIALIAGTIIVFQQLKFISTTNMGFDKENVLLIKYAEKLGSHLEAFRDEVKTYPGVTDVGIAMEVPGGGNWADGFVREGTDITVDIAIAKIDENYFGTLGFELVAGRNFERQRPSDKNAIIPNETTVQSFGLNPEQAIGQYIVYPGNENTRHQIIGVMKDSHYWSLHETITPIMFCNVDADIWGDWRTLAIKFKSTELSDLIQRVNTNWNKVLNDTPMDYSFLDQSLAAQYESEEKLGSLFGIFSALSLLIAIIGLTGLVSYSAEVRKKEIGIRKVFGASAGRIMMMMNSQFMKLIIISLVIATPFSWWTISKWLESFAYKIEISPFTFIGAGISELILALASVGYLSIKASRLNPTTVLKEE